MWTRQQRALVESLQDGTIVVEQGVVREGDLWSDQTISSLFRRGVLVRAPT